MNAKARFIGITTAALMLLVVLGWIAARRPPAPRGDSNVHAITDMTGQVVSVPVEPRRILSLCTLATDAIISLSARDRLVAIDEYSQIVPGCQNAAVIGKGSAISREKALALQIDLAFIWWYQDDVAKMLEDLSIPTLRIRSGRASELPGAIRLIGECINRNNEAESKAVAIEAYLHAPTVRSQAVTPRVFIELYGPFKTAGKGTYANDLLELAGMKNIADGVEGTFVFSAESLVQYDPDALLCIGTDSDAKTLSGRPGISELKAVRNGKVIALDRYWLVAGPNMPESVEKIRSAIFQTAKP